MDVGLEQTPASCLYPEELRYRGQVIFMNDQAVCEFCADAADKYNDITISMTLTNQGPFRLKVWVKGMHSEKKGANFNAHQETESHQPSRSRWQIHNVNL